MNPTLRQALIIPPATAILPCGLLAANSLLGVEPAGLVYLPFVFIAHCAVMAPAIPAFRKAPILSLIGWTLFYPLGIAAVLSLGTLPSGNPGALFTAVWWLAMIAYAFWWISIPVGSASALLTYIFTRSKPENTTPSPIQP